jgi:hypothetical protein
MFYFSLSPFSPEKIFFRFGTNEYCKARLCVKFKNKIDQMRRFSLVLMQSNGIQNRQIKILRKLTSVSIFLNDALTYLFFEKRRTLGESQRINQFFCTCTCLYIKKERQIR